MAILSINVRVSIRNNNGSVIGGIDKDQFIPEPIEAADVLVHINEGTELLRCYTPIVIDEEFQP
jgi:hypothetical protein